MPDKDSHRARAEANEAFFLELRGRPQRLLYWEVPVLFYAAVHWIESHLATVNDNLGTQRPERTGGHHPKKHSQRENKIAHDAHLAQVYDEFEELYNCSADARYELVEFQADFVEQLYDTEYARIRDLLK